MAFAGNGDPGGGTSALQTVADKRAASKVYRAVAIYIFSP